MSGLKSQLTVFENEDLIFDLKKGTVIKISERLRMHLGETFAGEIKTLSDFDKLTGGFSAQNTQPKRNIFNIDGDQITEYSLKRNGQVIHVHEISWIRRKEETIHIVLFFKEDQNLFQVSFHSLMEIVEKIGIPAILFDCSLTKVIVTNELLIPLVKRPFSSFDSGFAIQDVFVDSDSFEKVTNWKENGDELVLNLEAKLYLEKEEGAWFDIKLYKVRPVDDVLILCFIRSISRYKETEKKLVRSNELLSRVVEVQSHFLSKPEGTNPYNLLLSNILNLIDAKIGFVGKVDIDKGGKQVLKIHAATDISSNGVEATRLYNHYVKDDFLFRHFNNLFGACIVESKIILENNPPSNPHTKGKNIPGHPTIDNFLGVPIFKGDTVIGLIGLGNKEGGFDAEDIVDLKLFTTTYSVIIEAFKSEQDKIKFEKDSLEKAEILSKVADHSPDLIVVMNEEYDFEFISPSASQFFGEDIQTEELHRKIRVLLKKTLSASYQISEHMYRSRLKLNIKEDGEYWVESNLNILTENNKSKVIAVIRDVSLQMKLEEGLKESLEKEKQFNSFLADFMNIVSHEFKTPLSTIISSVELSKHYLSKLPDSPEIAKYKEHSAKIERELENLHKLVIHSLDYERFVNNSPVLKKENIHLRLFIEDTLAKHGFLKKINFKPEIGHSLTAELDKFLIQTVVINLVNNALKFGGKSKKPIVRVFEEEYNFGFEVKDFGIGIPQEDLPFIFTPFFRASNSTGTAGSGFGLVAVKNFVDLHHGKVSINSTLNAGTSVIVNIPK